MILKNVATEYSAKMADGSWTRSSEEIVCLAFVYSVNRSRESNLWKEAQQ